MKKLILITILLMITAISFQSCSSESGKRKAKPQTSSVAMSGNGNYVVIKTSDGAITDCYLLENTEVVAMPTQVRFTDKSGNDVILVAGDTKVVKISTPFLFKAYVEYHIEFDEVTYMTKYYNVQQQIKDRDIQTNTN
jgi:hypothetical protein